MLPYRVRRFRGSNDTDDLIIMTDREGSPLPHYYPNLFISSEYEQVGSSPHTIEKVLRAIGMAKCWASANGRDLDVDLSAGQFLSASDVMSLVLFLGLSSKGQSAEIQSPQLNSARLTNRSSSSAQPSQVSWRGDRQDTATPIELGNRLRWLAKYCEWHRHRRFDNRKLSEIERDLNRSAGKVILELKDKAPSVSAGWQDDESLEAPDPEILRELDKILQPESAINPFASDFIKWRNYLAWRLLVDTGARNAEVAQSKSDSVQTAKRRFAITKSKTLPRTVPIIQATADVFDHFFRVYWLELPDGCEAHRTGALFVDQSGRALTSGKFLNRMFVAARAELGPQKWRITPHAMRRAWNHLLSLKLDKLPEDNRFSPEQEAQTRIRLMGWSDGSRQAFRYNRRHIRERGDQIAEEMLNEFGQE